jgi:hypothetical protein
MPIPPEIHIDWPNSREKIFKFLLSLPSIGLLDNQLALMAIEKLAAPDAAWNRTSPKYIVLDKNDFPAITDMEKVLDDGQRIETLGFYGDLKMEQFIRIIRRILLNYQLMLKDVVMDEDSRKSKNDECNQMRLGLDILSINLAQSWVNISAIYQPIDIYTIEKIQYTSTPPRALK